MTEHDSYLRYLTLRGALERYGIDLTDAPEWEHAAPEGDPALVLYRRIEHELDVIGQAGFAPYFLIVADILRFCREQDIPAGPGRGSVCGSAVAYALYITDVEPIRFGIPFERFLHLERVAQPDIDIDVCQARRQEVIEYIRGKYTHVAQIAAFGTLMAKGVVREVCRILNAGAKVGDTLAAMIPEGSGADQVYFEDFVETEPGRAFLAEIGPLEVEHNGQKSRVWDTCRRLEGIKQSGSSHAAGVVIADRPLEEIVPLWRRNQQEPLHTQYDYRDAEEIGLLKMDVLGLRTVTVLGEAERLVRRHDPDFRLRDRPLDDKATYDLLARGDTMGVFQLEGDGITAAVRHLRPDRFDDITALLALYRPGPMEQLPDYVARKHGESPEEYPMEELVPVLGSTYGLIVFQEQVMGIARVLAGYTPGEADLFRKAIGKKLPELIQKEIARFTERAVGRGHDARTVEAIGKQIAYFGRYGFNLGHATGYAFITYWTAYLKANWPLEFYTATFNSYMGEAERVGAVLLDARRHGIEVLCPDINRSGRGFAIADGQIVFGLEAVKGLGARNARDIVEERDSEEKTAYSRERVGKVKKDGTHYQASQQVETRVPHQPRAFGGLYDFCARLPGVPVNVKEALIMAGAFAREFPDRALQLAAARELNEAARAGRLYNWKKWDGPAAGELEMIRHEREVLGFYVTKHPLETHLPQVLRYGASVDGAFDRLRTSCCVAGLITDIRTHPSKKGEMAWVTLESGIADLPKLTIFAGEWSEIKAKAKVGEALVVWGRKEQHPKFGWSIIASRALVLDDGTAKDVRALTVCLPETDLGGLAWLSTKVKAAHGAKLSLVVEEADGRLAEIRTERVLPAGRYLMEEIEAQGWQVRYDPPRQAALPWGSGAAVRRSGSDLAALGRGCPIWNGPTVRAALALFGGAVVAELEAQT